MILSHEAETFDRSLLRHCRGLKRCLDCHEPIHGQPYFYPVRRDASGHFHCAPYCHCSPLHAKQSVGRLTERRSEMLDLFHDMYGPLAPGVPRELSEEYLIAGGLTPEERRDLEQRGVRVEVERRPQIRSVLAPLVVTVTSLLNPVTHLPEEAIQKLIDEQEQGYGETPVEAFQPQDAAGAGAGAGAGAEAAGHQGTVPIPSPYALGQELAQLSMEET